MWQEIQSFVLEQVATNEFFKGGALIGILSFVGYQLKSFPKKVWERIERVIAFSVSIEETDELYTYFEKWLYANYEQKYRNVEAIIKEAYYSTPAEKFMVDEEDSSGNKTEDRKVEEVSYKQFSDTFMIFYHGRPLKIFKGREKFENASDFRSAFYNRFNISGLLSQKAIMALLDDVIEYNQQFKRKHEASVYVNNTHGDWVKLRGIKTKKLDKVVVPNKEELIADVDNFIDAEKWYEKRGIPYKRGYLFCGAPGNGKTTLALALAQSYKRDIYFLNLNEITDASLEFAFRGISSRSILAIEDVDCVFEKRKKENKVSFSTLLNCLDGVFYKEGSINILTTNHPEQLDPALVRDGRVDMKIEINNPDKAEVEEYLEIFFEQELSVNGYRGGVSMAEIQNVCLAYKEKPEVVAEQINKLVA